MLSIERVLEFMKGFFWILKMIRNVSTLVNTLTTKWHLSSSVFFQCMCLHKLHGLTCMCTFFASLYYIWVWIFFYSNRVTLVVLFVKTHVLNICIRLTSFNYLFADLFLFIFNVILIWIITDKTVINALIILIGWKFNN